MLITLVILESQDYIRFVFSLHVLFSNFPGVNLFVCLILYFYWKGKGNLRFEGQKERRKVWAEFSVGWKPQGFWLWRREGLKSRLLVVAAWVFLSSWPGRALLCLQCPRVRMPTSPDSPVSPASRAEGQSQEKGGSPSWSIFDSLQGKGIISLASGFSHVRFLGTNKKN